MHQYLPRGKNYLCSFFLLQFLQTWKGCCEELKDNGSIDERNNACITFQVIWAA